MQCVGTSAVKINRHRSACGGLGSLIAHHHETGAAVTTFLGSSGVSSCTATTATTIGHGVGARCIRPTVSTAIRACTRNDVPQGDRCSLSSTTAAAIGDGGARDAGRNADTAFRVLAITVTKNRPG